MAFPIIHACGPRLVRALFALALGFVPTGKRERPTRIEHSIDSGRVKTAGRELKLVSIDKAPQSACYAACADGTLKGEF